MTNGKICKTSHRNPTENNQTKSDTVQRWEQSLLVRSPSGAFFCLSLLPPNYKKRIKKKIGEHPHLSLAQARDIARSYNQILAQGVDPFEYAEQQAKEQARQSITLAEFALQWKRLKIATLENSESTMRKEWGRLNKHLFPYFGNKPLKDLAMLEFVMFIMASLRAYDIRPRRSIIPNPKSPAPKGQRYDVMLVQFRFVFYRESV